MTRKIHRDIITEEQRAHVVQNLLEYPLGFQVKIGPIVHPQTRKQQSYCHYLCRALAEFKNQPFEKMKQECKAQFGTVEVRTNLFTAERYAYCKSFSEYEREESESFILGMEAFMSEHSVPFVASGAEQ